MYLDFAVQITISILCQLHRVLVFHMQFYPVKVQHFRHQRCLLSLKELQSVFASALSGFRRKLFSKNVDDKYLWAQALTGLQTSINSEIRNLYSTARFTVLKELEAVHTSVKKLYPMIQDGVDFQRD
ncbi:protein BPS1, chloroplastic-like [Quercus lobata]|uniref:protein BPS1, chloroplastic-like n=1 Tax=Quercus lobata TaxID=97700 RepID=UPI001245456B|nr:protein BPS1, chloroplastic-like [Quercus lobata]